MFFWGGQTRVLSCSNALTSWRAPGFRKVLDVKGFENLKARQQQLTMNAIKFIASGQGKIKVKQRCTKVHRAKVL